MWTCFMDMHSGGWQKEPWAHIYIEAPEDEAVVVFFNRFGHNPRRVTCTCCGEDYSIDEATTLLAATAFERGCRALETPRGKNGLYLNDTVFPTRGGSCYLEPGEEVPAGFMLSSLASFRCPEGKPEGETLEEFGSRPDILIIPKDQIKQEERTGEVPEQGYVWVD